MMGICRIFCKSLFKFIKLIRLVSFVPYFLCARRVPAFTFWRTKHTKYYTKYTKKLLYEFPVIILNSLLETRSICKNYHVYFSLFSFNDNKIASVEKMNITVEMAFTSGVIPRRLRFAPDPLA